MGWEPVETPRHLILGTQYDKLLEVWDTKGFAVAFSEIENLFQNAHEAEEAKVILNHYNETFKDDPLPPIEGGNQHGFGIERGDFKVTGFLDKISEKEISGSLQKIVVERKTTSEAIEEGSSYWDKLDLDPQIRCYVAYLRFRGWPSGWVCYEVIRKLSSSYHKSLAKKSSIPIDQYRSLLQELNYNKKLVARKWIYVDQRMVDEFEAEHRQNFQIFKLILDNLPEEEEKREFDFVKHEQACDSYGGCHFKPICTKQTSLESCGFLKKGEPRFPIGG